MARGFESKSVADQQEAAMNPRQANDRGTDPRRRTLELARADVLRRLETTSDGPLREMLQRALTDVEERLRGFEPRPLQE